MKSIYWTVTVVLCLCLHVIFQTQPALADKRELLKAEELNREVLTLARLNKIDEALRLAMQCLEIRKKTLPPDHFKLAESYNNLGYLYITSDDPDRAEFYLNMALPIIEKTFGKQSPNAAVTLNLLGRVHQRSGRLDQAQTAFEKALSIREAGFPPADPRILRSIEYLAELSMLQEKFEKAENLFLRAVKLSETSGNPDLETEIRLLERLGTVYEKGERFQRAIEVNNQILEKHISLIGDKDPRIAERFFKLGELYLLNKDFPRSEKSFSRSLAVREKAHGRNSIQTVASLNKLGEVYMALNRPTSATPLFEKALAILKHHGFSDPELSVEALRNLGRVKMSENDDEEAFKYFEQALIITKERQGLNNEAAIELMVALGSVYMKLDKPEQAEERFSAALEESRRLYGPDHLSTGKIMIKLADLYRNKGEPGKSEPLLIDALEITRAAFNPDHPEIAEVLENLGRTYLDMGRREEAEKLLRASLENKERFFGTEDIRIVGAINNLAEAVASSAPEEAEKLLNKALQIRKRSLTPDHADIAESLTLLGLFYMDLKEFDKAETSLLQALNIRKSASKEITSGIALSMFNLGLLYEARNELDTAADYLSQAVDMTISTVGENHWLTADRMEKLVRLRLAVKPEKELVGLCRKILDVRLKHYGFNHEKTARTYSLLGALELSTGMLEESESSLKTAVDAMSQLYGDKHSNTAEARCDLGDFHLAAGEQRTALELYYDSLDLLGKIGKFNTELGAKLNYRTALALVMLGENEQALQHLAKDSEIRSGIKGETARDALRSDFLTAALYERSGMDEELAIVLDRLEAGVITEGETPSRLHLKIFDKIAVHEFGSGNFERANQMLEQAAQACVTRLGAEHPLTGPALRSQGMLAAAMGKSEEALTLLNRARNLLEPSKIDFHDEYVQTCLNIALLEAGKGNYKESETLFYDTIMYDLDYAVLAASSPGDIDRKSYFGARNTWWKLYLSLIVQHFSQDSAAVKRALDCIIRFDSIERREDFTKRNECRCETDSCKENAKTLGRLKRFVSGLLSANRDAAPFVDQTVSINDLIELLDEKKAEVRAECVPSGGQLQEYKMDATVVSKKLPHGSALILLIRTPWLDFSENDPDKRWKPEHYAAFVMKRYSPQSIKIVDLGDSELIDEEVEKLITALPKGENVGYEELETSCRRLHDLLFNPLAAHTRNVRQLVISGRPEILSFPFEILLNEEKRFMVERYTISRVPRGFPSTSGAKPKKYAIKAVIGALSEPQSDDLQSSGGGEAPAAGRSILSEIEPELDTVRMMFQSDKTASPDDDEVMVKFEAPEYVHLAGILKPFGLSPDKAPTPTNDYVNPFLAARVETGDPNHDALMEATSLDVSPLSNLNLSETKLVLLSFHDMDETPSDILNKALLCDKILLDGTEAVIANTWKTPTLESNELLSEFYKRSLKGVENDNALRGAILHQIGVVRKRYGHASPYYWGAFIKTGTL